jgi:hypothetical protein
MASSWMHAQCQSRRDELSRTRHTSVEGCAQANSATAADPSRGGTLGVIHCSTLAIAGGLKLTSVIPAQGYVLGSLMAWLIQIPAPPRTLFYTPPNAPFRPGRSLRFPVTFLFFVALGAAHSYLYGLLIGHVLLAFLALYKTRLQLAGVLLRMVVPVLLSGLAIRILQSIPEKSSDGQGTWMILLVLSLSTAGIFWALPYGKKLYWRGSWDFPYPRATPPELSQLVADPAVNPPADSGQSGPQIRRRASASGTRARAWILGTKEGTQHGPRYALLPGQSPFWGCVMWLAGWPCCLGALGVSFWGLRHVVPVSSTSGLFGILVMAGVSAFHQSRKLFLKGRRHLKLSVASPNALHPGSYVLYLRSFEDDKARTALKYKAADGMPVLPSFPASGPFIGLVASSRDEEEHIADALRPVGPLVAVGAPEEVLPFAGAVRMYLPKTSWHQPVRELMAGARLVTLTLGSSAGTLWELSEAMRILPPQRLLLLVPGTMREEEYESICGTNEATLRALPESRRNDTWKRNTPPCLPRRVRGRFTGPVIGVIHFTADWRPTFTRTPGTSVPWETVGDVDSFPWENLCTSLIRGLRPAFEQLAAYEEEIDWHCG